MTINAPHASQHPELKALWHQAFGDTPGFIEGFWQTGFSPDHCRCVTEDGAVTAALYWFDCTLDGEKWAYIYAVATEKAHRGKGLCAVLMENTHQHLMSSGYAGAALVPAEDHLWRYYEKFGYAPFGGISSREVTAESERVTLEEISGEEYSMRRAAFLPEKALDQRTSYPFYSTWGRFYRGDHCCFAAAKDEDTLYFQEFLGDASAVAAMINTLGAKTGHIRLPGDDPCGMFLSFGTRAPGYLGLPLD